MKIYVGCALVKASQEYRDFVASFKHKLDVEPDIEVLEFIGLDKGTATDVYRHDFAQVQACDAMLAFCDEPSIGLGMEIREAIHCKKPILCLHLAGTPITRMLIGAQEAGDVAIETYADTDSALAVVLKFLAASVTAPGDPS